MLFLGLLGLFCHCRHREGHASSISHILWLTHHRGGSRLLFAGTNGGPQAVYSRGVLVFMRSMAGFTGVPVIYGYACH